MKNSYQEDYRYGRVVKKFQFVMQTLTNVLNMPIKIVSSEQTCALCAGMFAAITAGLFQNVEEVKEAMGAGYDKTFEPQQGQVKNYEKLNARYKSLGGVIENRIESI